MDNPYISNIPYRVYYFSCNLEHVLHNIQNVTTEEKIELSEKFEDKYSEELMEFIKFINDEEFSMNKSYRDSWEFIKQGNNSLKRYTNFNLFFKLNI